MFLGIDCARSHDYTTAVVITVTDGRLLVNQADRLPHIAWSKQQQLLSPLVGQSSFTVIDSTGPGAMLSENLMELYPDRVLPVHFTAKKKQRLFEQLQYALSHQYLKVSPECSGRMQLLEEMRRVVQTGTRQGFKFSGKSGNNTDDLVIGLALALHAALISRGTLKKPVEHGSVCT